MEKVHAASLRVTGQSLGWMRDRKTNVRVLRSLLPTADSGTTLVGLVLPYCTPNVLDCLYVGDPINIFKRVMSEMYGRWFMTVKRFSSAAALKTSELTSNKLLVLEDPSHQLNRTVSNADLSLFIALVFGGLLWKKQILGVLAAFCPRPLFAIISSYRPNLYRALCWAVFIGVAGIGTPCLPHLDLEGTPKRSPAGNHRVSGDAWSHPWNLAIIHHGGWGWTIIIVLLHWDADLTMPGM
ncbi:hypothetical protein Fcan01_15387 [Folsomia candida]|uniref:Uncharacterized protein n=1 Tax=Folsomia candida TaxID=158441 RepID=A0A226DYS1_FOLCA|nr:hypothetical protein Fcan01_15387 [Folsomia candida]